MRAANQSAAKLKNAWTGESSGGEHLSPARQWPNKLLATASLLIWRRRDLSEKAVLFIARPGGEEELSG
jgi:hypothetical protein